MSPPRPRADVAERSPPHPHASRRVGAVGLAPPSIRVLAPPTAPRSPSPRLDGSLSSSARSLPCRDCPPSRSAPPAGAPPTRGVRSAAGSCSSPSPSAWPRPSPPRAPPTRTTGVGESGRAEALVHDGGLDGPDSESIVIDAPDGALDKAAAEDAAARLARRMGALDAVDERGGAGLEPGRLDAAGRGAPRAGHRRRRRPPAGHGRRRRRPPRPAGDPGRRGLAGRRHQRAGGRGPGPRPRCSRCPSRWA